jgi:hypothetical protein
MPHQTGVIPLWQSKPAFLLLDMPIAKMPSSIKQRKEHHSNKQQPTSSKPINNSAYRRIV